MLEYQFLESVSRKTLLGIRFWDPALDAQIQGGLRVTLFPIENDRKVTQAFRTRSGVYAFDHIPGMNMLETASNDLEMSSPQETRRYVLEVEDLTRQFSGISLLIDLPLPYNGIFLVDDDAESPNTAPKGFNLYSSINRAAVSQFTSVRGELVDRTTQEPAPHALVRVQTDDEFSWFGISDEEGKFSVMMPYPFLNVSFGASPSTSDGVRLFERTWSVELSVMYDPVGREEITGSDRPNYSSVLSQNQAFVYTEFPQTDVGEVTVFQAELEYGRDLIVRTAGFSELYISPTGSPA